MRANSLLVVAAICVVQQAVQAAPFSNGSFEMPDASGPNDRVEVAPGSYFVGTTGWQETNFTNANSGSAIYSKVKHPNDFVNPSNGSQELALNLSGGSQNTGGAQQAFDTVAGQTYTVSFDMSAIADGDNSTQSISYAVFSGAADATSASPANSTLAGGTASRSTNGSAFLTSVPYANTTFTFTADSATSTLRFVSLTSPPSHNAFGPVVDNVQVVPEPATISLLAVAGAGLLRRRRT